LPSQRPRERGRGYPINKEEGEREGRMFWGEGEKEGGTTNLGEAGLTSTIKRGESNYLRRGGGGAPFTLGVEERTSAIESHLGGGRRKGESSCNFTKKRD